MQVNNLKKSVNEGQWDCDELIAVQELRLNSHAETQNNNISFSG